MMEEEENKEEEQHKIRMKEGVDSITIGEVTLTSKYFLVTDLLEIFKEQIEKDPTFKKLLALIKTKKQAGYLG